MSSKSNALTILTLGKQVLKSHQVAQNIGDQLICGLCVTKKPVFMLIHEFMRRQTRLFSYLDNSYLHLTMELTTAHNNDNGMKSSDYENSYVPPCVLISDKELNGLTNRHVKLNTLDNTQECLSTSHHKIAFDDDEDTVS
jgi:hypothetical protein